MKKNTYYPSKQPELSELAQCVIEQYKTGYQRRRHMPSAMALPPETQKVLVIVRFASDPVRFAVVKDKVKAFQGLPGGGRDADDATLENAAVRECWEELRIVITADQLTYIGEVQVRPDRNHMIYVFEVCLSDREIFAGIEQAFVQKLTAEEIDELIEEEAFLKNHVFAWQGYKERVLSRR